MAKLKGELQADNGDVLYPHTSSDVVFGSDGKTVEAQIKHLSAYGTASGTNTYTATISGYTLIEGQTVRIKFANANTNASTLNINGLGAKSILKGNGNTLSSGNIKAGQICNLVYNGSNFQLLGEGGEYGTATASDVLSGKTIGTDAGMVNGTIPNNGAPILYDNVWIAKSVTNKKFIVSLQDGNYDEGEVFIGGDDFYQADNNFHPSNIKAGTSIFNFTGTAPIPSGTAAAAQVLSGYTFSNANSVGLSGSMPNQGNIATTLTTQGQQYTVPAGYHAGAGKVTTNISNLAAANIKSGVNVGGVVGNVKPAQTFDPSQLKFDTEDGYRFSVGAGTSFNVDIGYVITQCMIAIGSGWNVATFTGTGVFYVRENIQGGVWRSATSYSTSGQAAMCILFNPNRENITVSGATCTIYPWIL